MVGSTNKSQVDNELIKLIRTGLWEARFTAVPNLIADDEAQIIYTFSFIHVDGMEITGVSDDFDLAMKYFYDNFKKTNLDEVIDLTNEHSHDSASAAV